jgi:hypothetical protein
VVNAALQFVSNTKSEIDACIDYSRPHLAIEIEELRKHFFDAKNQIFENKKIGRRKERYQRPAQS